MSSVFERKESIETDKCVRFTRAPVAAFCLKLLTMWSNNFGVSSEFVCLFDWRFRHKRPSCIPESRLTNAWDLRGLPPQSFAWSSPHCGQNNHKVQGAFLYPFQIISFYKCCNAISLNITETSQYQSKSWLWPYCVLTHTK